MMGSRDFSERDIHLALDGEMPAEEMAAFGAWLDSRPEMQALSQRFAADREALRRALGGTLDEPAPARLAALLADRQASGPQPRAAWWRLAAAAVLLLGLGAAGGYGLGLTGWRPMSTDSRLAEDAIAAHVIYSAERRHVVEVGADEKDHLVGWLSRRVGLSLVAPDLTGQGFELIGGRLLPAEGRTAAQFMYEDATGNRISLYVTREGQAAETGFRLRQADKASAYYWLDGNYGCAIAGSVAPDRLLAMANAAYRQLLSGLGV